VSPARICSFGVAKNAADRIVSIDDDSSDEASSDTSSRDGMIDPQGPQGDAQDPPDGEAQDFPDGDAQDSPEDPLAPLGDGDIETDNPGEDDLDQTPLTVNDEVNTEQIPLAAVNDPPDRSSLSGVPRPRFNCHQR
jgi:hypothetical protein